MKAFLCLLFLTVLPLISPSPVHSPQALLDLLGEDLAALLSNNERGPPSVPHGSFDQLLSRRHPLQDPPGASPEQAWLRLFRDFVNTQKNFRGRTKKMAQQGCFGIKLDRIGTLSGLGC
ncbi:C-type natriuretic peptide-like [Sphaerodactylus townsendi]|uniref:Uncharacterized protein n=1 Tax=Sphaerodactylus townsendi TaxID=933632 RepID=A0ACB8EXM1_9SAUR|nr:C-type natriuretic peptide-like [Sphaerodactylus townsendi]